jgi:acyl carrier protein
MTEQHVLATVRAYIAENFLYARAEKSLPDDASLLASGVLDSLGVMELVGFVEQTFGLTVAPEHITEEHFGSLAGIARYVTAHPGARAAS